MPHEHNEESPYEMGRRLFEEGIREFHEGGYFEAHDLWEEFWQELRGPDRLFLQGLIHLAVGTYHFENANLRGAKSQLGKAKLKLERYPDHHWGLDTGCWRDWIGHVLGNCPEPPHPDDLPFDRAGFPVKLPMAPR